MANVADSASKAREIQQDDPSRILHRGMVGVAILLAVVIGVVLALLVNWINP
jgi:hypothetical protein